MSLVCFPQVLDILLNENRTESECDQRIDTALHKVDFLMRSLRNIRTQPKIWGVFPDRTYNLTHSFKTREH